MKTTKNPAAVLTVWLALTFASATLSPGATPEFSATGIITGNVSNTATGNLLEGATITLPQLNLSTFTDRTGRFVLTRVLAGTHELIVTYIGLDSVKSSVHVGAGERVVRDFDLTSGIYKLEAFTVTGEREGDAKAITEKRNASNVKDIVAMDSFGNLPNYAAGEVVRRLPGVAGNPSDEDQFDGFNIRGMSPDLNLITMDGGLIPTHNSMRNFELHQVSSTMFESLELIKGHTPDTGADSLGGTINLKTRSPLSLRGKRDTNYKLETRIAPSFFEQTPLREQHRAHPIVALGHREVFDIFGGHRNLGVAANLYYSEYGVGGTNTTFDYQNTTAPGAYIWDYRTWDNTNLTKQQTLTIRADYRLTPSTKLTMTLMGNDSFERHRRRMEVRAFTGSATTVPSDTTGVVPGAFNEKITVVRPTAASLIDVLMDGPLNFYLRTRKLDVGAEHEFGNLQIDYTAGISTTNLNTGQGTAGQLRMRIANTGWIIDRTNSDSTPDFRANGGLDFTDPNNYRPAPTGLSNTNRQTDQQLKQVRFNVRYQLPIPVPTFLK
ncbi:MAG: carboxypeptidase regulatory-like domain-containing protein, partial [Opitutaceae bacterium]